jgi:hypothetical protein
VEFWGLRLPTWDAVDMPVADLLGKFWGAPFRIWGATDITSAAFFGTVHGLFAFVLVGLSFAYIICAAINRFRQPRPATPMLSLSTLPQADAGQTTPPITANVVRGLAKNLRLFGWVECAQNRFKTGFLFKQKRLDCLLVSACGPYYQPFGNISFVCRRRPQHLIVNCEDRIATPWDSYYRSQ